MSETRQIGREIKAATDHMELVLREVSAFLRDVDQELGAAGLRSLSGNEPYYDAMHRDIRVPRGWLQRALGRLYARPSATVPAFVLEVHLTSPLADEAIVVLGVAEAGKTAPKAKWPTSYNRGGWVLDLFADGPLVMGAERSWAPDKRQKVLPGLGVVRAIVLPLASMTGREVIVDTVLGRCREWLNLPSAATPAAA